jgi:hypothetical protein
MSLCESTLRRRIKKLGYLVKKSRRGLSCNNRGGFMIIDPNRNIIIHGSRFELTLADLEQFCRELSYTEGFERTWL